MYCDTCDKRDCTKICDRLERYLAQSGSPDELRPMMSTFTDGNGRTHRYQVIIDTDIAERSTGPDAPVDKYIDGPEAPVDKYIDGPEAGRINEGLKLMLGTGEAE